MSNAKRIVQLQFGEFPYWGAVIWPAGELENRKGYSYSCHDGDMHARFKNAISELEKLHRTKQISDSGYRRQKWDIFNLLKNESKEVEETDAGSGSTA
jgi:hypothetical protein